MSVSWKMAGAGCAAAGIGALIAVLAMAGLGHGAAPDAAATGAIVRSYILAHPELIPEAMDRLQQKQTASLIDANRAAIETPFPGAIGGNPRGDVTLVEYFDYACAYCRASAGDVDRLIATDKGLRVVYKELPILSAWSDQAARLSLAAARAGKFLDYHRALYGSGTPDEGRAIAIAEKLGIDAAAATNEPDIDREIQANLATARAIRLSGTPSFVIGDQVLSGAIGFDALRDAIIQARAAHKA